jgi:AcrR family transcriptional regulator
MVCIVSPRVYSSARSRILDAAERVLLADGLGGFSIDAVIRAAELSKGGFFHHFKSKEELLAAVLSRLAENVEGRIAALADADRRPRGRRLRAQVQVTFDLPPAERERLRALVLALMLATIDRPSAVAAAAREVNRGAQKLAVKDGVPAGIALVVQLALDGYWLGETLGTLPLSRRERAELRATLLALTETKGRES